MRKIICIGDKTSHGGVVLTGSGLVSVDGKSVARKFDKVSCPEHGANYIIEGDEMHYDNGISIALEQHHCACGAILIAAGDRFYKG